MALSKTRRKKARYFGIVCAGLVLCASPVQPVEIRGLENFPQLQEYLQNRAVKPLEEEERPVYPAAVKSQLQKALKAQGYYGGRVTYNADEDSIYYISPGTQYVISSYDILSSVTAPQLDIKKGDPLIAQNVLEAQRKLLRTISEENCFYDVSSSHRIFLNHRSKLAEIEFEIDHSENATFGETSFSGANSIDREYLEHFIKYKEGECWKGIKLEDTRNALLQTGLISRVDVDLPEDVPADQTIPIKLKLEERAPRRVRLGANYNTSEGPGISAEWTHRNFFGSGEKLSVSTRLSAVLQTLGTEFQKPFFLTDKQNLNFSSELRREDTDAYEEFGLNIAAGIDRELSRFWTGSLGVALDLLQVREEGEQTDNFALVSFPARINYDSRDDVLNPQDGYTLRLAATPFVDAIGTSSPFFKTRVTGTAYYALGEKLANTVLALRASIGSIWGTETQDVPASFRFYAGGGGSIRGFGFQEAGPLDTENDPEGGRSLLETSTEIRWKFTEKIGGAAFVDAGGVYDSAFPDLEGGAYIGAGIGARYYTDFGPIRFDIAVPLNKKDDLDQNYQFYISIGQAF